MYVLFFSFFDWRVLVLFNVGGKHKHPCIESEGFLLCPCVPQIRRSVAKLELYRKFTNSLAVSVLLSVAWIGYEVFFMVVFPFSFLNIISFFS